ncbi:SusC/RagA family protein [Prevotella intermedia]|mgnify:FL=1|uniref:TonB-dependent receptor n=1 Tax=Prevotella intermedia TaxID=28131 RepID=A0A2M8TNH6_PREIN|nr:TonB-dependent receptor [Prevotella intermedia]OWP33577.1 SusC/RagA family protein [Prevotella intermedia]PJI25488.1 TonB-dependent receptor [Prevotella intermedia]
MKKRLTMFLACLFLSLGVAMAQTHVTGVVISAEDNQPVIGAFVKVLGTTDGAQTDLDGKFELKVPAGAMLEFSYVGMTPKKLKAAPNMRVVLESDSKTMEEVVVVAYGTQKKSAFTGSAAVVKSGDITKVQVTSAVDALKNKVSGVQMTQSSGDPGSSSGILIRGIGSINAGGSPLYVVDGSPFDGDIKSINPQDIESMTVLKDAASAALYGARGANGVIIITTKAGRADRGTITVDAKWGSKSRAIPDYDYITDPAAYYEMYYKGLYNYATDAKDGKGMTPEKAYIWANKNLTNSSSYGLGYNVYTYPSSERLIGTDGKLNPNATLGRMVTGKDGQQYWLQPDNWLDAIYSNALRQEYSATAVGNTDKSTFYGSVNYLKDDGITVASDYRRFTGRLKADYQINDWLRIGGNMNYSHYSTHSANGGDGKSNDSGNMFAFTRIAPIYPLYLRDGNKKIMRHDASGLDAYDYGDNKSGLGLERPFLGGSNALSDNRVNLDFADGNTFNGVATVDVRFLKDLTFRSVNSVYLKETRAKGTVNPWFGLYATDNGSVTVAHNRTWSYNYQQVLNWKPVFGSHDFDFMVGHEYYRLTSTSLSGNKSNMFDLNYAELSGAVVTKSTTSGSSLYNTEGWFGRINYSYGNKYFGEVSYRRDASSMFHPNHRWGNFWSLGGAWLISKESWFNAPWVDELKFKASYGAQGNDNIDPFLYTNTYSIISSDNAVATVKRTRGNENISWEKQGMFNVGFDFSFFRQRLTGSIVYFDRATKDMLAFFSLPLSFGWTGYYDNIGDMSNRGLEVELFGDIIRTRDFKWGAHLNLTTYKNKITRIADANKTMWLDGVQGYNNGDYFYGEGKSMYTFRLKKYAGVDPETGKALYWQDKYKKNAAGEYELDKNGQPIVEERVKVENAENATYHLCGTSLPDVYGGFGTNIAWKGFDFSIDFGYQLGGQVYDGNYAAAMNHNRGGAMHVDLYKAWSPENKGSNIPRVQSQDQYTTASSDRWLTSASYLSLQNINLGYTLPAKLTRKYGVAKIRIYAVGDNLWLWSKRKGLDPRQSINGGVSNVLYSNVRTISGGITVTF